MQEQPVWKMEQPDPEVFRRVWERVMEGREEGPIQLAPSERAPDRGAETGLPQGERSAPSERAPEESAPEESTPEESTPEESPAQVLRRLGELAREGAAAGERLERRTGGRSRALSRLAAQRRIALRRLGTAYFLETGERWDLPARRPGPGERVPLDRQLREEYLWEERWERACRQAARRWDRGETGELCRELAREAALRAGTIRRLLEGM